MQLQNHSTIKLSEKKVSRLNNLSHLMIFEWIILLYQIYLFASVLQNSSVQIRILIYCITFLIFEKLELTYKYLELEDPLHLTILTKSIRYAVYLCIINLSILIIRIIIDQHNLHSFIMMTHFMVTFVLFFNELSKKNTKIDMNIDSNNVFTKIFTPLFLFIFNKTSESSLYQLWIIEFVLFAINLFLGSELMRILLLKQSYYFGWNNYEQNGKKKSNWNKNRSLRSIIVASCVLIVTQNLLLIFDSIKNEISITIIHTFIIAILAYLLYIGYGVFKK